jgi:hypothetical protein
VDIIGIEICRLNFVNVLNFIFGAIGSANIGTMERTTGVGELTAKLKYRREARATRDVVVDWSVLSPTKGDSPTLSGQKWREYK